MSKFKKFYDNYPEWMQQDVDSSDVVLTSRIRLARNLDNTPFPGWAKKDVQLFALQQITEVMDSCSSLKNGLSFNFGKLNAIEKQVLVERHLISREHAAKGANAAVFLDQGCGLSFMANEEDHLRLQSIQPGLNLQQALNNLDSIQTLLEDKLPIAYDRDLGYLTACPTNLGTGMRASAMLHLPALGLQNQLHQSMNAISKLGLAVRGLYGEGTESSADLFQISNQSTLGSGETEIITKLNRIIGDLITQERQARIRLLENDPHKLQDKVSRAYSICKSAYLMASQEALSLLSILKMGISIGFFQKISTSEIDQLLLSIQPAHLQISNGGRLSPEERDFIRAEKVRSIVKTIGEPDFSNIQLPKNS